MKVQTISGTCKNQAMPFNLPIFLTWLRVALVPLLVGIFYLPEHWISLYAQSLTAAIIFIVAAITDWIDGYLARKWNQTSAFGAFLDPVADKLIVAGSLLVLVQLGRVSAILGFIIIGREIAIRSRQFAGQGQDHCADDRHSDAFVLQQAVLFYRYGVYRYVLAGDRSHSHGCVDVVLFAQGIALDEVNFQQGY